MHRSLAYSCLFFLSLAVLAWGCTRHPPQEELEKARAAYKVALESQADVFAGERLQSAKRALDRSIAEMKSGRYEKARESAALARREADAARVAALDRLKQLRTQAEAGSRRLAALLSHARQTLAAAGGLPDSRRDALSYKLDDLELALSQLSFLVRQGDYAPALKGQTKWLADLGEVTKEIETAAARDTIIDKATKKVATSAAQQAPSKQASKPGKRRPKR